MKMMAPQPALQLGVFALACALTLAATHAMTRNAIAKNEAAHTAELLTAVMPHAAFLESALQTVADEELLFWQAVDADSISGIVIPVTATGGYSGDIELLVGINRQQTLTGVRVTKHRETPGLGDFIDERRGDWIHSFTALSLQNPTPPAWLVKKDGGHFDQFTGATITPRAIVKAVREALQYSQKHQAQLFSPAHQQDKP